MKNLSKKFFFTVLTLGLITSMVSNANIKEELNAPQTAFDTCDAIATAVGAMYDLTHYEEWLWFDICMQSLGE